MNIAELKQIQLSRQYLTKNASKETVIRDLCGIQCQFLNSAIHSLLIRCKEEINKESLGENVIIQSIGASSGVIVAGAIFTLPALYILQAKFPTENISVSFVEVFLASLLGGIIGIPFMIQSGIPDASSLLFLLLAGFLFGLTYTLYAIASRSLTALETVLLPVLDPVLNPVWVFLVMHEMPGIYTIAGAVLILAAILARSLIHMEEQ